MYTFVFDFKRNQNPDYNLKLAQFMRTVLCKCELKHISILIHNMVDKEIEVDMTKIMINTN